MVEKVCAVQKRATVSARVNPVNGEIRWRYTVSNIDHVA
jgi:hypothetical protein